MFRADNPKINVLKVKSLFFSLPACPFTLIAVPYCLLITTILPQVIFTSSESKQGKTLNWVTFSVCMYGQELIIFNFGCRSISQYLSWPNKVSSHHSLSFLVKLSMVLICSGGL